MAGVKRKMSYRKKSYLKKRASMKLRQLRKKKYADSHNVKLQGITSTIYGTTAGSVLTSGAVNINTIQPSGGYPAAGNSNLYQFGGIVNFKAENTLQWTQFSTLYDRYKINGVKVRFIPLVNVADTKGNGLIPELKIVYDRDDGNLPTVGDVWARQGRIYRLNKPVSIYLKKPSMAAAVWAPGANPGSYTPGYVSLDNKFVNTSYSNVPHYGIKFAMRDFYSPQGSVNVSIRVEVTYYMTFKEQVRIGAINDTPQLENLPEEDLDTRDADAEEDKPCEDVITL